jgi:hypothetical protein
VIPSGPVGEKSALSSSGFYYSTETVQGRRADFAFVYLDIESGQVTELFRKQGPVLPGLLAVSPDEQWIPYGERPASTSELMLVKNFR